MWRFRRRRRRSTRSRMRNRAWGLDLDAITRLAEESRAAAPGPHEPYAIPWAGGAKFIVFPTATGEQIEAEAEAAALGAFRTPPRPAGPPPRARPSLFSPRGDPASCPAP